MSDQGLEYKVIGRTREKLAAIGLGTWKIEGTGSRLLDGQGSD